MPDRETGKPSPMQVQMLGTGTPIPHPDRAGSSVVVLLEEAGLLFDCGHGTTVRLVQAGIPSRRITHLFFSHLHFDHCVDFPHFGLTRWDRSAGSAQPLQVMGPQGTELFSRRLFGPEGAFAPDIRARRLHPMSQRLWMGRGGSLPRSEPELVVRDVATGLVASGRDWEVRAAVSAHVQPHLECYCYRIDGPGRSVVYTGDTGYSEQVVALARGADVLIHMCSWTDEEVAAQERAGIEPRDPFPSSPSVAARAAAEAGVRELVLTHMHVERLRSVEDRQGVVEAARRVFGGPVRLASDLMVV